MNLLNFNVIDVTCELLKNIGTIATFAVLFLHKFPLTPRKKHFGVNLLGLAFFSMMAVISIVLTLETQGFIVDLRIVPILLAAIYLGIRESVLIGLLTIFIRWIIGGPGWIPWAMGAPFFGILAVHMLGLLGNSRSSWRIGLVAIAASFYSMANFYLFATIYNGGVPFQFYTKLEHLLTLFSPIIISNVTGAVVLNWVINYLDHYQTLNKAVAHAEGKYRSLVESSVVAVYIIQGTKLVYANKALSDITSYSNTELLALDNIHPFIHPDDRNLVQENIRKRLSGELCDTRYELRLVPQPDTCRYVEVYGSYIELDGQPSVIGTMIDITDRKLAEMSSKNAYELLEQRVQERTHQLAQANATLFQEIFVRRATEKRYRQLFDSVQDAIFVWRVTATSLPGKFIEVNNVACRRLGYTRDELLTLSPPEIITSKGKTFTPSLIKLLKTTRQAIFETEYLTKDGQVIPIEVNVHIFDLNGELVGLSIARDISDRKQTENELHAARERIGKTEKLAFLGNMAAGIAHEINQPLNSIKVTADSILMWSREGRYYHWEEFLDDIQIISQQSERIANIIRNVRDIIRTNQQTVKQLFNLNNAINNSLKMLIQHIEASNITISKELANDPLELCGSLAHLEHVVVNLVNNAIDSLENSQPLQKEIRIRTALEDRITLEVSDNGTGISELLQDKLFTPFFTTKSNGMGLGLDIVQSVVTSHDGKILMYNNETGGATFRIEFPLPEAVNDKEDRA